MKTYILSLILSISQIVANDSIPKQKGSGDNDNIIKLTLNFPKDNKLKYRILNLHLFCI